jgi:hypothetical protein
VKWIATKSWMLVRPDHVDRRRLAHAAARTVGGQQYELRTELSRRDVAHDRRDAVGVLSLDIHSVP